MCQQPGRYGCLKNTKRVRRCLGMGARLAVI
jgi:hypothetical protein